tara:strand:+ start:40 stop:606 length:567 start_codon:yes stop_codon:yes gene_type:complete
MAAENLEVLRGLAQAAADSYDGALDEDGNPIEMGLKREDKDQYKRNRTDGFGVRFAHNKAIISYHSEIMLKEVHPRAQFENNIEDAFKSIVKRLKKRYSEITSNSVTLTAEGDADIHVQNLSRQRTFVVAKRVYKIGSIKETNAVNANENEYSSKSVEDNIKAFMDQFKNPKKAENNKAPANPDTPSA